ncbi:hypothetical protein [Pseudomonas sp.]|uniref:hypothetical protein n=1 Tax=Pseudomonas sp. TaxID=306 RepID=UPI003D0CDDEF
MSREKVTERGPYRLNMATLRRIAELRFCDVQNTWTWKRIAEEVGVAESSVHRARKGRLWRRVVEEVRQRLEGEAQAEAMRALIQILRYGNGAEKVQAARALLQHHAALNAELKHSGEIGLKVVRVPIFEDGSGSDADN